jgi:hypothetical protein
MTRMNWSASRARHLIHSRDLDPLREYRYAEAKCDARRGPTQYAPLREAVYEPTARLTYQLVMRVTDNIPHTITCKGNHPDLLEVLNEQRRLAHERNMLDKRLAADGIRGLAGEDRAQTKARLVEIKTALSRLRKVNVDRADRTAQMLMLYERAESQA